MMKAKKTVVMLVQAKQHYLKLYSIAEELSGDFDIQFLIDGYDGKMPPPPKTCNIMHSIRPWRLKTLFIRAIKYIIKRSIYAIDFMHSCVLAALHAFKGVKYIGAALSSTGDTLRAIKRKYDNFYHTLNANCNAQSYDSLHKKRIEIVEKLKSVQANILVLAEANIEYHSEMYIQAAHQINAKVVIIPYTFCAPSEPATHYKNSPAFLVSSEEAETLDPKWIYEHEGILMKRLPLPRIQVMEELKIVPPYPWIQESSSADVLIAESERIKQHYLRLGISEKQVRVLGDVSHDRIFSKLNNSGEESGKLLRNLKLSNKKRVFVFAIFPDYTKIHQDKCEFRNYKTLLKYICDRLLSVPDVALVLSLHPSMNKSDYLFLESDNIKIAAQPVSELIPLADLYIASVSATIKWAIAAGIPVLNYDVYKFRYNDYIEAPGVLNFETSFEFENIIEKLKADNNYLNELKGLQDTVKDEWGCIDGKFCDRLKKLLNDMSGKK